MGDSCFPFSFFFSECLVDYGTVYCIWNFSFERFNGLLGSSPNNHQSPETTFMRRWFLSTHISPTTWRDIGFATGSTEGPDGKRITTYTSFADFDNKFSFPMHQVKFFDQTPIFQYNLAYASTTTHSNLHPLRGHMNQAALSIIPRDFLKMFAPASYLHLNLDRCLGTEASKEKAIFENDYVQSSFFINNNDDLDPVTHNQYSWLRRLLLFSHHAKMSLFDLPFSNMTVKTSPKVWNLRRLRSDQILLPRRNVCNVTSSTAWTVLQFKACIQYKLLHHPQSDHTIAVHTDRDIEFKVVNINWDKIEQIKKIDLGYGEILDSSSWYNGTRSFVLVVCPERDEYVLGAVPIHSLMHPARINCFIRVEYDVALVQFMQGRSPTDENYTATYMTNPESGFMTKTAIFAVCDFFASHICRTKWSFGGVAELWDQRFFTIGNEDYATRSQYLVPLNRIAGKFIPGFFTKEEFSKPDVPVHGSIYGTFSTPMVVMRLPQRIVLDPSNIPRL